jgi:hypothetical protein
MNKIRIFLIIFVLISIFVAIYFSGGKFKKIKSVNNNIDKNVKIPNQIMQTLKSKNIPSRLADNIDKISKNNPKFSRYIFDDNDIINYLESKSPEYIETFKKIDKGVIKADFFRLLWLYNEGGIYADIDAISLKSFKKIENDIDMLILIDNDGLLVFHLLFSSKKNELIEKSLKLCRNNIENKEFVEGEKSRNYIVKTCGPELFTKVFKDFFAVKNIEEKYYIKGDLKVKLIHTKKFEDIIKHKNMGLSYYIDTYRADQGYWGIDYDNIKSMIGI